jgi:cytidylate kinase
MRIAISSFSGAGTTTACKKVAGRLGLSVVNYTMRNYAAEKGARFEDIQAASNLPGSTIDYEVDSRIIENVSSAQNIVIGSLLACWLVPDADLYVWLEASSEVRAQRVLEREVKEGKTAIPAGKPAGETDEYRRILSYTNQRDAENVARYRRLYGLDVNDHDWMDLKLNVDNLTAEEVAERITQAALASKGPRKNPYFEQLSRIIRGKVRTA